MARARAIGERAEKARYNEMDRTIAKPLASGRVRPGDPALQQQFSQRFGRYYAPALGIPEHAALTPFLKTYGEDRDSLEQLAREYGMDDDSINRSRATQLATPEVRTPSTSRPRLDPKIIDRLSRHMADEGPAARFDPDTLAAMWARHGDYVEGSDIPERWVPLELSERGETAIEDSQITRRANRLAQWERSGEWNVDNLRIVRERVDGARERVARLDAEHEALRTAPRGQRAGQTAALRRLEEGRLQLSGVELDLEDVEDRIKNHERDDPRPAIEDERKRAMERRQSRLAATLRRESDIAEEAASEARQAADVAEEVGEQVTEAPLPETGQPADVQQAPAVEPSPERMPEPERFRAEDVEVRVGPSSTGSRIGKGWFMGVIVDGRVRGDLSQLVDSEEEATRLAEDFKRTMIESTPSVPDAPQGTFLSSGDVLLDDGRIQTIDGKIVEPHEIEWKKVVADTVDPSYIDDDAPEALRTWRDEVLSVDDDVPAPRVERVSSPPTQRRPRISRGNIIGGVAGTGLGLGLILATELKKQRAEREPARQGA